MTLYKSSKLQIINILADLSTRIHFTLDLWTSPNHRALLGIIAHWISQSGVLQSTVLGLRRFKGRHTGENQAESLWAVAQEYKIEPKIGYFTLDNASNNDTAMKCISAKLRELNIEFDPVQSRLRCHGHIINLVVKAFVWGEEPEAFELEAESLRNQQDEEAELLLWRRRVPIGKLHNIIVWIGRSPQRRDKFNEKVKQLHPERVATPLVYGNGTRWGGDYNELVRALQHREALEEFVSTAIRYNLHGERDALPTALKLDELHPEDWTILTDIMQFLQPFRKWQLMLQGHRTQGALFDVLPAMDELLLHMEDRKAAYNALPSDEVTHHMVTAIKNAWSLLDKYYNMIDDTPVYYSAIALHPEMKLQWFRDEWQDCPSWIAAAESAVRHDWVSECQTKVPLVRPSVSSTPTPVIKVTEAAPNVPHWKSKKRQRQAADTLDQVERFQERDPDDECPSGVLQYWVERLDDPRQSPLAYMAVELMSIPAMSDEPERLFSSAKLLISDQRNRLGDDIIEASECLKSWVKQGFIFGTTESDMVRMEQMLRDLGSQSR
jgi:hypothetical protein